MGTPEQDITTCRRLITAQPCVIVAPDYRLGIEAPYPAALDDCHDALLWLKTHAGELGVRDDQLAVAGMSAGGGLTAALTLLARDCGAHRATDAPAKRVRCRRRWLRRDRDRKSVV